MPGITMSFCIVTNGKRMQKLKASIESIRHQNIPAYEIIVCGRYHQTEDVIYIPCLEAADGGYLGTMRNLAVARAQYPFVVMLDDDIILSSTWYATLQDYRRSFDILTSQIRLPEGGRYWDHATFGGPRGHILLTEKEYDDHVYMTGGGGWVMRREVADNIRWDENRAFYEGEDVDFSRRCQRAGFLISHHHAMTVLHDDASYTCVGRKVFRRHEEGGHVLPLHELAYLSSAAILQKVEALQDAGRTADAADLLRLVMNLRPLNLRLRRVWWKIVRECGGFLPRLDRGTVKDSFWPSDAEG